MNKVAYLLLLILLSCSPEPENSAFDISAHPIEREDPSSFTYLSAARIKHLSLSIRVDFDSLSLKGVAGYNIERNGAETIHFDIDDLEVSAVFINDSANYRKLTAASYTINTGNEFGDDLEVKVNDYTSTVHIVYKTKASSKALQWLTKEQTRSKNVGFLYTNGFANHTRSWIPIQDSPGIRISYQAVVKTPRNVMALMSAPNAKLMNDMGEYEFFQENPVPPYLIALAVGEIQYNPIIDNIGVYAEPSFLIRASDELEDLDIINETAESLFGKYQWKEMNILVMPSAFPLGGMENPELAFISSTIIAGDKSLTSVLVHEIAHAWSNSIVSNITWNDFWLNEGLTVYMERRILEELKGKEYIEMEDELAFNQLIETMKILDEEDTHLKLKLEGRSPDEALTAVAYDKGYLFFKAIENEVGREKLDLFLRNYLHDFAFQCISTEDFLLYLDENLLQKENATIDLEAWVYSPGLPEGVEIKSSVRSAAISDLAYSWVNNGELNMELADQWETQEKLYFLSLMPEQLSSDQLNELDSIFAFSDSNAEIKYSFFILAIRNSYDQVDDKIANFLTTIGRAKFVKGLYKEMKLNSENDKAKRIFKKARGNYHPYTQGQIDVLLNYTDSITLPSALP